MKSLFINKDIALVVATKLTKREVEREHLICSFLKANAKKFERLLGTIVPIHIR